MTSTARELTFLLTDVQDSTRLWEESPEQMAVALARHDRIIREAIREHGGEHKPARGEGDSHFAVFLSPVQALECALRIQRALAAEPWPDRTPISVRIGIHAGAVERRGGDYYGPTVNRAARLRAIAHGGQTVMSAVVADAAGDAADEDVTLRDRGRHRLKDLEEPLHVFEVCHPDLDQDFPPLMSLDGRRHNLPIQLTSFIGREDEIQNVTKLLADGTRLVTLVGPGGVGKTRLSLQAAAELVDSYPDGVRLVELAAVTDPARVAQELLSAVGAAAESDALRDVVAFLTPQRMLIVFDNCEQVLAGAAEVANAVLQECPGIAVLATTREPLDLPGERLLRLTGMSIPEDDDDQLAEMYPAVRLFVDRAQAKQAAFALDDASTQAIIRISRDLDGLPLAIELAAARVTVLSPQQIAERLHDRFALLTGGPRTRDARQRTMRAAIDWSHDLLQPDEAVLFRRLSVFVGGWTLEAAESVCGAPPLSPARVLDLLSSLVEKSLVVVSPEDGRRRYHMLESIRFYARDRLEEADELGAVGDAHLRWVAELTKPSPGSPAADGAGASIAAFRAEADNIRAGLDRAALVDPATGLTILWNTSDGWESYAVLGEAISRLETLLADHTAPDGTRLYGLSMLGLFATKHSRLGVARAALLEAVELARRQRNDERLAVSLVYLAEIANLSGDADQAEQHLKEAQEIARQAADNPTLAGVLAGLARLRAERDLTQAILLLEEALQIRRESQQVGHVRVLLENLTTLYARQARFTEARAAAAEAKEIATAQGDEESVVSLAFALGRIAQEEGNYSDADALFQEAALFSADRGLPNEAGYAWALLGESSRAQGDLDAATHRYARSIEFFREAGNAVTSAFVSINLGHVALRQERYDEAWDLGIRALATAQEKEISTAVIEALELCGEVDAAIGNAERALRLFGAAEGLREEVANVRDLVDQADYDSALSIASATVGEEADGLRHIGRSEGAAVLAEELLRVTTDDHG